MSKSAMTRRSFVTSAAAAAVTAGAAAPALGAENVGMPVRRVGGRTVLADSHGGVGTS